MAGYSGTPLARKLGIAPESAVLLDGAPPAFDLGPLPPGVVVHRRAAADAYPVIVSFCLDAARLRARWAALHARTTPAGALWIAWPKKASQVPTDLTEDVIRAWALAHGRVDVKVCAVDDTWSGLRLCLRKELRAGRTTAAG